MERLTTSINGNVCYRNKICTLEDVLEKLYELENKQEQGLLMELPVAIGKPIYKVCYFHSIKDGFIHEEVMSVEFYAANKKYFMAGKVYRTKEEAEQALEQMKAGGEDE